MKKSIIKSGLLILVTIISVNALSQERSQEKQIRPALLVIDIQEAYLGGMAQRDREIAMLNINYYIQLFRNHGYPVIRIYHFSKQMGPEQGTPEFEFPKSVLIKPDDPRVIKTYPDAFNKTGLNDVLKEKGCNTVFLCGLSAVGCVLATWYGAQNNDYKAFMIKDAIISHREDYTQNVEVMFDAVGPDVVTLILENSKK